MELFAVFFDNSDVSTGADACVEYVEGGMVVLVDQATGREARLMVYELEELLALARTGEAPVAAGMEVEGD